MPEPAGGWIRDEDWKEPSSIVGPVEECRARLREHIAESTQWLSERLGRSVGGVEMTAATARACGIEFDDRGQGEFEGTRVHVR